MQIKSGTAKVLSSNHQRVQFSGITGADAALLAAGQQFKFQGETNAWFNVQSVISLSPTVEIELTASYAGSTPYDTFATYLVWQDFTPNFGLMLPGPNDVDLRDSLTYNFNIIDDEMTGGGGGGGLTASGVASVTTDAVSKTVSGTFPSGGNYVVLVTPNWLTAVSVRPASKSTTQYIVDFSVPAPSGAELNWGVV